MTVAAILKRKGHDVAAVSPKALVPEIVKTLAQRRIGAVLVKDSADRLHTVSSATTVPQAMALMTDSRVRHLPVLDDGELVGMISIGDVVRSRLEQQEQEVDSLKAYVAGSV
jgi:CBS domain-containing protein